MSRLRHWTAVAMTVAMLAGSAPAAQALADERADLKVELVGLPLSNGQREVKVRVTNVSTWWADKTRLSVETVSPKAGNARSFDVENLDPGQSAIFTYALAAPCDGDTIKAQVTAAKNYAGVAEGNVANNAVQAQICPAKAQPAPKPQSDPKLPIPVPLPVENNPVDSGTTSTSTHGGPASIRSVLRPPLGEPVSPNATLTTKPSTGKSSIPEHLRTGLHGDGGEWPALVLAPSALKSVVTSTLRTDLPCNKLPRFSPQDTIVGWLQWEGDCFLGEMSRVEVAQTAVAFDLSQLDEIPNKFVLAATLTYDEQPFAVWDDHGHERPFHGCVERLGIATNDWQNRPNPDPSFANDLLDPNAPVRPTRTWNVTDHVQRQLKNPTNRSLRFGYVLRGALDVLDGENDRSCLSTVSNLRLRVEYRVQGR